MGGTGDESREIDDHDDVEIVRASRELVVVLVDVARFAAVCAGFARRDCIDLDGARSRSTAG